MVVNGQCRVDVGLYLQNQFVNQRAYNRGVISADTNAFVKYFIKFSTSKVADGFVMQSDEAVIRYAVNAALDTAESDWTKYVIGDETAITPTNPPVEPPPPVVDPGSPTPSFYEKIFSETIGFNPAVCQETLSTSVYANSPGLHVGMALFTNQGLSFPLFDGWYKVFFIDGFTGEKKCQMQGGFVVAIQDCTGSDYFE
jgi:hypothetical protein